IIGVPKKVAEKAVRRVNGKMVFAIREQIEWPRVLDGLARDDRVVANDQFFGGECIGNERRSRRAVPEKLLLGFEADREVGAFLVQAAVREQLVRQWTCAAHARLLAWQSRVLGLLANLVNLFGGKGVHPIGDLLEPRFVDRLKEGVACEESAET